VLRNPGIEPQTLKLPKIPAGLRLQQIYPVYKILKNNDAISLGGLETAVVRGVSERGLQRPLPEGVDYELAESLPNRTVYKVFSNSEPKLIGDKPKSVNSKKLLRRFPPWRRWMQINFAISKATLMFAKRK